jgi:uncharacterized protein (UPF0332 family)
MNLKRFEALGLIEKARFSHKQILANVRRARRDLLTAAANLNIDEAWAYTISYHAMLSAARALMFAYGYRSEGKDQHKTAVEFSSEILGQDFLYLTTRFNRMRVKRHDFIYEPERPIPKSEAEKSLKSAEQFVKEIAQRISDLK